MIIFGWNLTLGRPKKIDILVLVDKIYSRDIPIDLNIVVLKLIPLLLPIISSRTALKKITISGTVNR